jgi:hypothetical protein
MPLALITEIAEGVVRYLISPWAGWTLHAIFKLSLAVSGRIQLKIKPEK